MFICSLITAFKVDASLNLVNVHEDFFLLVVGFCLTSSRGPMYPGVFPLLVTKKLPE